MELRQRENERIIRKLKENQSAAATSKLRKSVRSMTEVLKGEGNNTSRGGQGMGLDDLMAEMNMLIDTNVVEKKKPPPVYNTTCNFNLSAP